MTKKLTGTDINGKRIVVEVADKNEEARAKRAYGKAGIALESVESYAKKEGKRIVKEASR